MITRRRHAVVGVPSRFASVIRDKTHTQWLSTLRVRAFAKGTNQTASECEPVARDHNEQDQERSCWNMCEILCVCGARGRLLQNHMTTQQPVPSSWSAFLRFSSAAARGAVSHATSRRSRAVAPALLWAVPRRPGLPATAAPSAPPLRDEDDDDEDEEEEEDDDDAPRRFFLFLTTVLSAAVAVVASDDGAVLPPLLCCVPRLSGAMACSAKTRC